MVRATDPAGVPQVDAADAENSDEVTVLITVTDVNEAPVVAGGAAVTFNEDTGDITESLGEAYMATDLDVGGATTPIWSVAGPDGGKFTAVGGDLKFKAKPDYENATDANTDNVYEVTVQASDGKLTGMRKVKVTVENADEAGVVTLSKTQPRVGIAVTASLTDPDGSISSLTWQWSNEEGEIEDANSDTYKPVTGDVEGTLTATASYTDGHDTGKSADAGSANMVAEDTRNKAPTFGDEDAETGGVQNDMATRKVDENTAADAADDAEDDDTADNVGAVVMATDPDPNAETPTYTLGGTDAAKFRVRANGQIEVGSGTKLDYETKTTYMVTLTAEDSFGSSSSIAVTIMVNPIDEVPEIMRAPDANVAPEFASATTSRTVAENTAVGEDIGNPVAAADANGDALTYALSGTDAASFAIDSATGQLMTLDALDYETKATYSVTVTASDSGGLSDPTIDVTVTVTDVNEAPVAPTVANQTATKDTAFSYTVPAFTDPESGTITYAATLADDSALPEWLNFNASTRELSGTPLEADTPASLTIKVSATDDGSPSASAQVTFTLTVGEEAPTTLLVRYDGDKDGWIQLGEARVAVGDYFAPPKGEKLSLDDTRKVVGLYFEYKNSQ